MNERRVGNGIRAYHSCIILLLFIFALTPSAATNDLQFRANPEHTGVFDNNGIVPGNTKLWRFTMEGIVYSSPAVSNGVTFPSSAKSAPLSTVIPLISCIGLAIVFHR